MSLSNSFLLVHRNGTDYHILILYPATLLNSCISSHSFLVVLFYIILCYVQIVIVLIPIWIFKIYFSYLIAIDRTSDTMLNKSSESGHPCLVPDLREIA